MSINPNFIDGKISGELERRIIQFKKDNPKYKHYRNKDIYKLVHDNLPDSLKVSNLDSVLGLGEKWKAPESKTSKKSNNMSQGKDPSVLAQWLDAFGDAIPDDAFFSDAFQIGYQKSIGGSIRELEYGEPKFDLEKMYNSGEISALEDLTSNIIALTNPLDASLLFAGGIFGAKRFNRRVDRMLSKSDKKVQTYINWRGQKEKMDWYRKNTPILQQARDGFIRGAYPMAVYEGARGYVQAQIDGENPYLAAAKYAGYGFVTGGFATGFGSGIMGRRAHSLPKYNKFSPKQIKNMSLGDKAIWAGTSVPMQIIAESGAFAGFQTINEVYMQGKDFRWEDLRDKWVQGAGLFGVLRGKHALMNKGRDIISNIKGQFKKAKNNSSTSKAMQNVQQTFKKKTDIEDKLKPWNDAMIELSQGKTEASNDIIKIYDDIKVLEKNFDKAISILKSGKAPDSETLVNTIKDIEADLYGLSEDLKAVDIEPGSIDQSVYGKALERLENFNADYFGFVEKNLDDSFKDYYDNIPSAAKIAEQLQDVGIHFINRGDKQIPLYDPKTNKLNFTAEELQDRLDKKLGKDDSGADVPVTTKDRFLAEAHYNYRRSKGEKGKGLLERKVQLAELLGPSTSKPLKGNSRKKYNSSRKWVDNMIQTFYPTNFPQTGGGAATGGKTPKTIKSVKDEVRMLNEFAEWLADSATPKNFSDMTVSDVTVYLSENPSHKWAIRNLHANMKARQGAIDKKIMDTELAALKSSDVSGLAKEIPTEKQLQRRKGARVASVDTKNNLVSRVVSKRGQPKHTPISDELSNILSRIIKTNKDNKIGLTKDDDFIFVTTEIDSKGNPTGEGLPLRLRDVNAIIEHLFGSKLTAGGAKTSAKVFRKILGEFADNYDLINKTDYYSVIDAMGLGHGKTVTKKQLKAVYGKGEISILDAYNFIKNELFKSVGKPKQGDGKADPHRYTILEIRRGLKAIKDMKDDERLKLEVTGNKTKGSQIHRTYSKDTVEGVVRWLIENPSRLNEIVLEDGLMKDFKNEIQGKIDKNSDDFIDTKSIMDKADELDGPPSSQIESIQNRIDDIAEIKRNREEFLNKDPHRDEKIKINSHIKILENQIFDKNNSLDIAERNDMRRGIFKTSKYEVNPNYTLIEFEAYRDILKTLKDEKDNPTDMDKFIIEKFLPKEMSKELAIKLGAKDGDPNKLSAFGRTIFKDFVKEFYPQQDFSSHAEQVVHRDDAGYLHLLQGGRNPVGSLIGMAEGKVGVKRATLSAWVLAKNMEQKSKGKMKVFANDLYQFLTDFYPKYSNIHGICNTAKNDLVKIIKGGDSEALKYTAWLDKGRMDGMLKVIEDPNTPKEEVELTKKDYDKQLPWFKLSEIEGSWAYLVKIRLNEHGDRMWDTVDKGHKVAHEPIKGTDMYDKQRGNLKDMKEDDYMPRLASNELLDNGKSSDFFQEKLDKEVKKRAPKEIHKHLKSLEKFKHLKGKKIRVRLADQKYRDAYNERLKLYKKDKSEYVKLKQDVIEDLWNGMTHGGDHIKISNFMSRGEMFPEWVKVEYKTNLGRTKYKYVRAYKNNLEEVLTINGDSNSRLIATMETAPEYLSKSLYYNSGVGKVKDALRAIDLYELKRYRRNTVSGKYWRDLIETQIIGLNGKGKVNFFAKSIGQVASQFGLSGIFEAGFKNLGAGQVQTWMGHDTLFYRDTWAKFLACPSSRDQMILTARELGVIGYTKKEFEGLDVGAITAKGVFTWSGQAPAEDINRIIDVNCSLLQFECFLNELGHDFITDRQKSQLIDHFRDVARFTEKDIELITSGKVFEKSELGDIARKALEIKYLYYVQKATQGGLDPTDLPSWMTKHPNIRYAMTFVKILRSVSDFAWFGMIKPAVKHQNVKPILKWLIGFGLLSEAYDLYKEYVWKEANPVSLGNDLQKFMFSYSRVNSFYLFEYIINQMPEFNPYYKQGSYTQVLEGELPAVEQIARGALDLTGSILGEPSWDNVKHNLHKFGKENLQLYSQYDKFKHELAHGNSKDFRVMKKANSYKRQRDRYLENYEGIPRNNPDEQQRWLYDFKHDLFFQEDEEKLAQAYWEIFDLIAEKKLELPITQETKPDPQKFVNEIHTDMMASINTLNPGSYSQIKTGSQKSILEAAKLWIFERGGAKALKEYQAGIDLFMTKKKFVQLLREGKGKYGDWQKEYSTQFQDYNFTGKND